MSLQINLESIDPAGFQISRREEGVLVQPLRTKLRWREEELSLRSLWLDHQGRVRSAGWPKFFNYGENEAHDERFLEALAAGRVEFAEKLDGTLIIADRSDSPETYSLRTRGQLVLGEFEAPVRALISERFPQLPALLQEERGPFAEHSLLFEFVSPDHPVVIPYSEPALFFLGAVCKRTLRPRWEPELVAEVSRRTGIPAAPIHTLPNSPEELLREIASVQGKEGFVARFVSADGSPGMLKLKTAEYVRIHGNRAALGERGSKRLAFLLELRDEAAVSPALARLGFDHEAIQCALWHLRPFFVERSRVEAIFSWLRGQVAAAPRGSRRVQVDFLRDTLASNPETSDARWLAVAIKLLDGRERDGWWILEAELIGEPVPTLRAWDKDRDAELARMVASIPGPSTS